MARPVRRAALAAALAAAALLLAFSALMSVRAPLGPWSNLLFGEPAWYEFDPGSFYVAAAHDLAFGRPALFVGHPGTPLLVLLDGVQRGLYALSGASELSYTSFTARNLPAVFVASKLLASVLHLVSFGLLFAFARRLLRDELAAWCACLGYATSLPALYYLSRISVEPLMMICLFGAFLALWRWEDLMRSGDRRRALVFAALTGAVAATGAVTKLNFLGPLPAFLLVEAALAGRSARRADGSAARETWLSLAALTSAGVVTLWFWSRWIDWAAFFGFWSAVPPMWHGVSRTWKLWPAPTAAGLLPLAEFAFVSVALVGLVDVLRRGEVPRARVLVLSAFAAFTLVVFAYRVKLEQSFLPFHYFLPATGILAVFFGAATARMLRGLTRSAPVALAACAAWLLVIHGLAVYAVVDSRLRDAAAYEELRASYEWIAHLAPDQRIGVRADIFAAPGFFATKVLQVHTILVAAAGEPGGGSSLRREFERLFEPIPSARLDGLTDSVFVPALGTEVFAVGAAGAPAGGR